MVNNEQNIFCLDPLLITKLEILWLSDFLPLSHWLDEWMNKDDLATLSQSVTEWLTDKLLELIEWLFATNDRKGLDGPGPGTPPEELVVIIIHWE